METQLRDVLQSVIRQSGNDTAGGHIQSNEGKKQIVAMVYFYDRSKCDELSFFRKALIKIMCSSSDDDFMDNKFTTNKVKMLPLSLEV